MFRADSSCESATRYQDRMTCIKAFPSIVLQRVEDMRKSIIKEMFLLSGLFLVTALLVTTILAVILMPDVPGFLFRQRTPVLHIHVSGTQITGISFKPSNYPTRPDIFDGTPDGLIIAPIYHGWNRVSVKYNSDQEIWAAFLHDGSVRKRIDLFFQGDPNLGPVKIRCLASEDALLYEGEVVPNDTSEEKPFSIP